MSTTIQNTLTLDNLTIRQDSYGRYCLNDLHAAAGGAAKDGPKFFLANEQTQEFGKALIRMVENRQLDYAPIHAKKGAVAKGGGTYVVKQLVYRYAMWISPEFELKVINAYDRLATQGVAVHEDKAEDV